MSVGEHDTVIRVLLVNGESRSVRLDPRTEVADIIYYILSRLRSNMEVSPPLFGILLYHISSGEHHWLTPGFSVLDLITSHCGKRPLEEWRFHLRIRVLPKTPQNLFSQDPVAFSYYYDQVLHMYLEDDSISVDNETALRLGCLEMRRFFRDMSQTALKKKENFAMIEKDYGFEKFFKKSFLQSARKRNLNKMIQTVFQQFDSLTSDGCIFQFFSILGRFHPVDSETFSYCAIGDDNSIPLTTRVSVGPNCEVEYETELAERRHLVSFNDIHEIIYEPEFTTRGKVIIEMKTSSPVIIRTAQLITAVHMTTLIDAYCQVYTQLSHSRLSNGQNQQMMGRYYDLHGDKSQMRPLHEISLDPNSFPGYTMVLSHSDEGDYAEVRDTDKLMRTLGRPLSPKDIILGDRIGEGQFGDVHTGILYPDMTEEAHVAVKTCKPDSTPEEKTKFLQEAAVMKQFNHPHIIKLFGVVTQGLTTYIVMELAPLGQLRQYMIFEGPEIPHSTLLEYIRQLCSAMVHLESKNYVHRDIAARNILVVSRDKIKLSDFGLSRWLEEADFYVASRGKLPIKWMAPESINFRRFTGASDVWMFGVCCWEILTRGIKPFMGIKNDEVIGKLEQGERLQLPSKCPGPLFNLMNHCWQYDPEDRPSFREVELQLNYILEEERKFSAYNAGSRGRGHEISGPPQLPTRNLSDGQFKQNSSNTDEWHAIVHRTQSNDESAPPLPPRPNNGRPLPPEPLPTSPPSNDRQRTHRSDSSVDPYLVTKIPGAIPHSSSSSSSPPHRSTTNSPPLLPMSLSPIPPPAILRNQRERSVPSDDESKHIRPTSEDVVYYSTVGNDDPLPSTQPTDQVKLMREPSPYEPSTSSANPQSQEEEEEDDDEEDEEGKEVLHCTTAVVKAVMGLSTQLSVAKPNEYFDLVKTVGLALRELLAKVDTGMDSLPEHTHHKVQMAHKVLSSDMAELVKSMKQLQENYHSFLLEHYQKQMLQSATIVAVNSKHLLEAYNSARRSRTHQ